MYDYDAASARFFFTWQYLSRVCLFLSTMVVYTIPHLQVTSLDHICQSYDPLGPLPVGVMPQRDIALVHLWTRTQFLVALSAIFIRRR